MKKEMKIRLDHRMMLLNSKKCHHSLHYKCKIEVLLCKIGYALSEVEGLKAIHIPETGTTLQMVRQIRGNPKTHSDINSSMANKEMIVIIHTTKKEDQEAAMETPETETVNVNIIPSKTYVIITDIVNLDIYANFVDKVTMPSKTETGKLAYQSPAALSGQSDTTSTSERPSKSNIPLMSVDP